MNSSTKFVMKEYWKGIIASGIVFALADGFQLYADPTDDETRDFRTAEQAYKEGAFDLASDRIAALLKKYPKTELAPQAEVLEAKSLYQLGRSDAALAALNLSPDAVPENLRSDTIFWQAEALLDLGRWPDAEQKFRAVLTLKNDDDRADEANLGLAQSLFMQGKEADAVPLIQTLIKSKGSAPTGEQAQLLLAKLQLVKAQFKDSVTGLQALIASQPERGIGFEASYWLGEAYAASGRPDLAIPAYQKVTADEKAFPRKLIALAYLGLGRAQFALHQNDQAMLAYEKTYQLTENEATGLDAFRSYLECARASGQLPEAVAKLQEFAKSDDVSAPGALFAMGSVLAEDREDDRAIGILESLLVAYPAAPWIPAANYQLGELYARTGKPDLAIKALQTCIAASPNAEFIPAARSELGHVLLASKDYAGAAAQFSKLSVGTDSAAENAAYNFVLAQAGMARLDTFAKAEADFDKRFPKSTYFKATALAKGQMLSALNKTDDAKAAYVKAVALPGGGSDQKELLNTLADLQYQTGDLNGTLVTCQAIVDQFPNDSLAAAQRGIQVSYELKKFNEDQVEHALTELAQKYNNAVEAPEVYFALGEFYFFHQDYVKAQDAFQQLITNYPNSDGVDRAYFFAGRAAFAHQDYVAARTLLEKVPDTSPFKPDARLWDGRVFQQQLNFDQARTLYDSVLASEKNGPRFVEANLYKGQCLFEQGATDPANYTQAIAAFDQILKSREGSIADRNQAAVSSAKCLEKLGRTEDAMKLYLDVLYGRELAGDVNVPAPPESFWPYEAASQAGGIREKQKDWRGAIEIYRRAEQIGGAHAQDFHDLINKLRRDNYIYE